MIRAVDEMGRMNAWHRFFEQYRENVKMLHSMAALPVSDVLQLSAVRASQAKMTRSKR